MRHPVDIHVGNRIRHRRWMVKLSQQQLAGLVGVKFQQVQKYETGMNRVSASRLWSIAGALGVPISFFFEDVDEPNRQNPEVDKGAVELMSAYMAVGPEHRRSLLTIARTLKVAGSQPAEALA